MIIGLAAHDGSQALLRHLGSTRDNDTVVTAIAPNLLSTSPADAMHEMRRQAIGCRSAKPFIHVHASPSKQYSDEEWATFWELFENEFGLSLQPWLQYEHGKRGKGGRTAPHRHRVYLRINPDRTAIRLSHSHRRAEKIARIAEVTFGERLTAGAHDSAVSRALRREGRRAVADMIDKNQANGTARGKTSASSPQERIISDRLGELSADEVARRCHFAYRQAIGGAKIAEALLAQGLRLATGEKAILAVGPRGGAFPLLRAINKGAVGRDHAGVRVKKRDLQALLGSLEFPPIAVVRADLSAERLMVSSYLVRPGVDRGSQHPVFMRHVQTKQELTLAVGVEIGGPRYEDLLPAKSDERSDNGIRGNPKISAASLPLDQGRADKHRQRIPGNASKGNTLSFLKTPLKRGDEPRPFAVHRMDMLNLGKDADPRLLSTPANVLLVLHVANAAASFRTPGKGDVSILDPAADSLRRHMHNRRRGIRFDPIDRNSVQVAERSEELKMPAVKLPPILTPLQEAKGKAFIAAIMGGAAAEAATAVREAELAGRTSLRAVQVRAASTPPQTPSGAADVRVRPSDTMNTKPRSPSAATLVSDNWKTPFILAGMQAEAALPTIAISGWKDRFKAQLAGLPSEIGPRIAFIRQIDAEMTRVSLANGSTLLMRPDRVTLLFERADSNVAQTIVVMLRHASMRRWTALDISGGSEEWQRQAVRQAVEFGFTISTPALAEIVAEEMSYRDLFYLVDVWISLKREDHGKAQEILRAIEEHASYERLRDQLPPDLRREINLVEVPRMKIFGLGSGPG